MRSGLLAFGVLLLLLGAALYFIPGAAAADTRSFARPLFSVSALASIGMLMMVLGAILALLGLIVPAPRPVVEHHDHARSGHVVETRTTRNGRTVRRTRKEYDE